MGIDTDKRKIDRFLSRGIENVYPSREFVQSKMEKGEQLTLYFGIDPTGPDLHLGHAIALRKMREFQDLGHRLVLLIGDFTGMIGDPTDKSAARKRLSKKDVLENAKNYKKQAGKILRMSGSNKADIRYNSKWLGKLSFADIVELSTNFTVQQFMERDMFQNRVKEEKPIYLHEFLYPLMQAYDSVAMNIDGEIGGNDQTFNMLAGRDLMKAMRQKEKFVVTTKLLVDPTGKKMGKSEGNMITLADSAEEMFGKIMSWPDGLILPGFELLTDLEDSAIKEIAKEIDDGANPRDAKVRLGKAVVELYFSISAAEQAEANFVSTFSKGEIPEEMPVHQVGGDKIGIIDLLLEAGLAGSKSEARRLLDGSGVKVGGEVVRDYGAEIFPTTDGLVVQKGKRHFVRVVKG